MTIDEAIKHCLEVAEEQSRLYSLCPCPCDGTKDCMSLKNGKDMGCTKCAADHRQLAVWLKELKELKAADVQPVKRGRWVTVRVDGDSETICNNCYENTIMRTDFCPHCGAKMTNE